MSRLDDARRHHEAGDFASAAPLYQAHLERAPDDIDALYLFGTLLLQIGEVEAAREPLTRAVTLSPNHVPAWSNLAVAAEAMGDADGALSALDQVLRLEPGDGDVRSVATRLRLDLAAERAATGDLGDALEVLAPLRTAGAVDPDGAALGCVAAASLLMQAGHLDAAREAAVAATDLAPGPETWTVRAEIDLARRDPRAALIAAEAAVLEGGGLNAALTRATCLAAVGRASDARAAFQALADSTGDPVLHLRASLSIDPVPADQGEIDHHRSAFAAALARLEADPPVIDDPADAIQQPAMMFAYHGEDERPVVERYAHLLRRCCPLLTEPVPLVPRRARPRVALVSAFLHAHTIGKLTQALVHWLAPRVELILVRWPGPEDGLWQSLARVAAGTLTLPPRFADARRALAEVQADVIHYPELGMHLPTLLLAHGRLARVQTVGWGHPVTTGLDSLDAMLSVAVMEPAGAEAHYTEPLIGLPGPGVFYPTPVLPADRPGREALGLPAGRLYVCPQSLFKLHPAFDATLAAVLAEDPKGYLVLIDGEHPSWTTALRQRLAPRLDLSRVILLPRLDQRQFYGLMAAADVLLDVPHWSGGNSTLEALALGTPIVTTPGRFMRGRHTAGFLTLADLPVLASATPTDYATAAHSLATSAARPHWQRHAACLFNREDPAAATLAHWHALLEAGGALR
ncbi:MAG: hypothetical protein EAZ99_08075 [Alphaproteobacteria bacterium]|nr:MAG: hypothetical protein EAZ99_08075 [Alphaproteobacteria bacterium]